MSFYSNSGVCVWVALFLFFLSLYRTSLSAVHFNLVCIFSQGISVWRCDETGHACTVSAKSTINLLLIVD